jgi:flagellar basal body-associated protein FliL
MEATVEQGTQAGKKPGGKSKIIAAVALVAVLVAGTAGAVVGPKLLNRSATKKAAAAPAAAEPIGETTEFAPIVVDTRSEDGAIHHLKVVISVELAEGTKKEEFMKYAPRAREAAISYLRSEPFEIISAPQKFEDVRKELSGRIIEAVGQKRISRVLVVDFVAQ